MKLGIRVREGKRQLSEDEKRARRRRTLRRCGTVLVLAALAALPGTTIGENDRPTLVEGESADDGDRTTRWWEMGLDVDGGYGDDDLELPFEDTDGEMDVASDDGPGGAGRGVGQESTSPVVDALTRSGIPEVAMRAYMRAQETLAQTDPSCGLRWSLVAAIGRVESNHGRYGGAQLRADGYGTKPIRGIPLDGRPGVAVIRDTDDGRLDGDTVYDRAVGPMQFIPSSWPRVAADGNGDGQKDPNNIFDAAIGAGNYLCSGSRDLRVYSDRYSAVRSYNHSDEYVRIVLSLADQYERGAGDLPQEGPAPGSGPGGSPSIPPPPPQPPQPPASVTPAPSLADVLEQIRREAERNRQGGGGGDTWPPGGIPPTTSTTTTSTTTTLPPCPSTTTTSSTSSTSSTTTTSTTTTTGPTTTTTWPAHCPTTTTTTTSTTTTTAPSSSSSSSSSSSTTGTQTSTTAQ